MSKWVPVLVRLEDYPEIVALIAEREASRPDTPTEVETVSPDVLSTTSIDPDDAHLATWTPWSVADLRTLSEGASATAKRWTLAMDACCEVVGTNNQWLSTSQVAERTGMSINEWRDAPRKITRHLKANFPKVPRDAKGDHIWPLLARGKPGSQEVHWAMSSEQAERWRQVRGIR